MSMSEWNLLCSRFVIRIASHHSLDLLLPGFSHRFASRLQWNWQSWIHRLELYEGFIWIELADNIVLKVCCSHRIWILLFAAIASHRICRVGFFTWPSWISSYGTSQRNYSGITT